MKEGRKRTLLSLLSMLEDVDYHVNYPTLARIVFIHARRSAGDGKKLNYKFVRTHNGPYGADLFKDIEELEKTGFIVRRMGGIHAGELFLTPKADDYPVSLKTKGRVKRTIRFYSDPPHVLSRLYGPHVLKMLEELDWP